MIYQPGQTVYVVLTGYGNPRESEVTIKKVGRKWATFDGYGGNRFDMHTGYVDGFGGGRVYASKDEYAHEKALDAAWTRIRNSIDRAWNRPEHLTLESMRAVEDILRC
jgi:hypothetical protein